MNSLIGWKQSFVQKIAVVISLALVFASVTPVAEAMQYKTQTARPAEISATVQISAQSQNLNSTFTEDTNATNTGFAGHSNAMEPASASFNKRRNAGEGWRSLRASVGINGKIGSKDPARAASYTLREMGLSAKLSAGAGNNLSAQDIEAALNALGTALSGSEPNTVALSESVREELRALAKSQGLNIEGLESSPVQEVTRALDGGRLSLSALHKEAEKVARTMIGKVRNSALAGELSGPAALPSKLSDRAALSAELSGPAALPSKLSDRAALSAELSGPATFSGNPSDAAALSATIKELSKTILAAWQVAVNELRLMLQGRTAFLNKHAPQTDSESNHRAPALTAIYNLAGLPENAFTPQSSNHSVTVAQLWQLVRYHAIHNIATRVDLSNLARAGAAASATIRQLVGKPALMTIEERVEEFSRDLADYNSSSPGEKEAKKKGLLKKVYSILKSGSNFPSGPWGEDSEWLEEKLLKKFGFEGEGHYQFAYGSVDEKGNRKVLVFQLRSIGEDEKGSEKPVVLDKIYVCTMPSVKTTTEKLYREWWHIASGYYAKYHRSVPHDARKFLKRNDKQKIIKALNSHSRWFGTGFDEQKGSTVELSLEDAINRGDAFELSGVRIADDYGTVMDDVIIDVFRVVDRDTPKDARIYEKTFWEFSGEVARDGSMDIEMGGARVGYDLLMNDDTLPQDLGQLGAWRAGFVSRLGEIKAEAENTGSVSEEKAQGLRNQLFVFMQRPISTNVEDLNQTPLRRLKNIGFRFDETVPIPLDAKGDEKIQYWNDPSFEHGRDFFIKDNEISLGNSRWGGGKIGFFSPVVPGYVDIRFYRNDARVNFYHPNPDPDSGLLGLLERRVFVHRPHDSYVNVLQDKDGYIYVIHHKMSERAYEQLPDRTGDMQGVAVLDAAGEIVASAALVKLEKEMFTQVTGPVFRLYPEGRAEEIKSVEPAEEPGRKPSNDSSNVGDSRGTTESDDSSNNSPKKPRNVEQKEAVDAAPVQPAEGCCAILTLPHVKAEAGHILDAFGFKATADNHRLRDIFTAFYAGVRELPLIETLTADAFIAAHQASADQPQRAAKQSALHVLYAKMQLFAPLFSPLAASEGYVGTALDRAALAWSHAYVNLREQGVISDNFTVDQAWEAFQGLKDLATAVWDAQVFASANVRETLQSRLNAALSGESEEEQKGIALVEVALAEVKVSADREPQKTLLYLDATGMEAEAVAQLVTEAQKLKNAPEEEAQGNLQIVVVNAKLLNESADENTKQIAKEIAARGAKLVQDIEAAKALGEADKYKDYRKMYVTDDPDQWDVSGLVLAVEAMSNLINEMESLKKALQSA